MHTDFSRGRSGIPNSWRIFHRSLWSIQMLFGLVNKAEVDVFLVSSCFFYDPVDFGNLMSGSSAFPKSNVYIWKFIAHVLLKPVLNNLEHYFVSVWDECNCALIWTFFGIAFLWDWNKIDLFQSNATAKFSKFACILSAALSQNHLLGF